MNTCGHDPKETHGAVGMYHCPECGQMVLAGIDHVDYSLLDDPNLEVPGVDTVMNEAHTPGPWEHHVGGDYAVVMSADNTLAHVNTEANARLIAAAPELLDSVKDLLEALCVINRTESFSRSINQSITAARTANARATGGAS